MPLRRAADDGIVVVGGRRRSDMRGRVSVADYFGQPESTVPMELVWGVVHEPPAPRYGHQAVVTNLAAVLHRHVRERRLGVVCVSPIDVVLDPERALVVQPDIVFVSAARRGIARGQVWGAPDLVVEVLSASSARRDRTVKLEWYRSHGARECWLVDPARRRVTVVPLAGGSEHPRARRFAGNAPVESAVLGRLGVPASEIFSTWS
jgi:Uma2 family endonuclease